MVASWTTRTQVVTVEGDGSQLCSSCRILFSAGYMGNDSPIPEVSLGSPSVARLAPTDPCTASVNIHLPHDERSLPLNREFEISKGLRHRFRRSR